MQFARILFGATPISLALLFLGIPSIPMSVTGPMLLVSISAPTVSITVSSLRGGTAGPEVLIGTLIGFLAGSVTLTITTLLVVVA
jgi:hypothetical protein